MGIILALILDLIRSLDAVRQRGKEYPKIIPKEKIKKIKKLLDRPKKLV